MSLFAAPIAHRGLWSPDGPPENSLAAFAAAADAGYGIELDVQLSADGEAMVFHDDRLGRLTPCERRVAELSAAELGELRLNGGEEPIPTLEAVLATVAGRVPVFVELKVLGGDEGPLERRVAEVLEGRSDPLAVLGFNPAALAEMAKRAPDVPRGLNSLAYTDSTQWTIGREERERLQRLEHRHKARADFLSLGKDLLPSPHAEALRREGTTVIAWTLRSPAEHARVAPHIDGFMFEGWASLSGFKPAVRVHASISAIGEAAWDACAGGDNPFIAYDFLQSLEESGSVSAKTGWAPQHLAVEDEAGIAAVMPLYLKSHSQGEYVFDHGWAQAYQRAGGRYYPKLQCAAPFTPATGPRLLVRPDVDRPAAEMMLLGAAEALCERLGASSLHVTFPTRGEWERMGEAGLLLRQDRQHHWINAGYDSFDAFLAALSSSRRKTIRRERRDAQEGLVIERLTGATLTEAHWDAFFPFYMDTGSRKWGRPYLNRRFFSLLHERMADRVLLVMARSGERWIAGALNLIGGDALYGRNWGCIEDRPFLHFELCYYQAIEAAIERGLGRVEAGAQGEHKIARGYLPTPVYSAHHIADPALREPVRRYLDEEREAVSLEIEMLTEAYSPFRQG